MELEPGGVQGQGPRVSTQGTMNCFRVRPCVCLWVSVYVRVCCLIWLVPFVCVHIAGDKGLLLKFVAQLVAQ